MLNNPTQTANPSLHKKTNLTSVVYEEHGLFVDAEDYLAIMTIDTENRTILLPLSAYAPFDACQPLIIKENLLELRLSNDQLLIQLVIPDSLIPDVKIFVDHVNQFIGT
jgi:hypothetical protein